MQYLKSLARTGALIAATISVVPLAYAAGDHGAQHGSTPVQQASEDTTEGEVRKVDKGAKKITLKHGEIKNLEMPPMTMVFQVKDESMLESVKPGDKVRFKVERLSGALVLTEIRAAQ